MLKSEKTNYAELYGDAVVSLTPFSIKKMGLVSNQTLLKVDTYNLVCVPYRVSMKGVVLLGSFSQNEILFFQRFKGALAGLNLVLHPDSASTPVKVFCRCSLNQIASMKNRESIGLISADFRPCPPFIETAIGDYLMFIDRLHVDYKDLKDKVIPMNPESARVLGFNSYATLTSGTMVTKLSLFSLSVNKITFLTPMTTPDIHVGETVTARLFFQKYQFNVSGRVSEADRLSTGVQRGVIEVDFSPELVDLLGSYYLQAKLRSRRGPSPSA